MKAAVQKLAMLTVAASVAATHIVLGAEPQTWGIKAEWSAAELKILGGLHLDALPPAPDDPSNKYQHSPEAAGLGKKIFFDPRFSANGKVSCASCHAPELKFQDNRALGQGMGTGLRRTMPVAESGRGPWQFWDGRKDSLWSQALGPMEDALEHGGNRTAFAKLMGRHYRAEYEAVFQRLPNLEALPDAASPNGTPAERSAWAKMSAAERDAVSRVYANMGKAIAAYERKLHFGYSRLDAYIAATLRGEPAADQKLNAAEKRGLRLFIGKAQCITCHAGPLFTDQHFHNTGVPPRMQKAPDQGRAAAIAKLLQDEFNCKGPFSDAKQGQCQELDFLADDDPHMLGAFKTPGLRNVAERAPFMHAGQIPTIVDVLRHYSAAPKAAVGKSERQPMPMSESDIADLAKFLGALSSPIVDDTH